jgi:hypothetical protein
MLPEAADARQPREKAGSVPVGSYGRLLRIKRLGKYPVDDATISAQKADLDRRLAGVSPNVSIAFGPGLFAAFHQRGWFTLEKFGAGEPEFPAYGGTHFVFPTQDVPDLEFRVRMDAG